MEERLAQVESQIAMLRSDILVLQGLVMQLGRKINELETDPTTSQVHQVATSANNELHDALRKWTLESLTTEKVDPLYISEVLDVIRYLDQYDRDHGNDQEVDK